MFLVSLVLRFFQILWLVLLNHLSCLNVDSKELLRIGAWTGLESLHFDGFKLIGNRYTRFWFKFVIFISLICFRLKGGPDSFKRLMESLVKLANLKELRFINFTSFVLFEYQNIFTAFLSRFEQRLKSFQLSYTDFFTTNQFWTGLSSLHHLNSIELETKNVDLKALRQNLVKISHLKELILVDVRCQNTKTDIKAIKDVLKK